MAFHDLTISDVRPVADDAVSVTFAVPDDLRATFRALPGQFLTLRATVGGEDIRRSYSIASAPDAPLTVGIRAVDEGRFSQFAQGLKAGDHLLVMPPEGRFTYNNEDDLLLIAAGSGITPMVAIASEALARGAHVTLVYGNRTVSSIMFLNTLEALKDRYLSRFTVIHLLSREAQDVPLLNGRITAEKVSFLAKSELIAPKNTAGVFLCGPGDMITEMRNCLSGMGIPEDRIHSERFSVEGAPPPRRPSQAAKAAAAQGVDVEIVLDGARRHISVEAGDANIVDAAARQGLELPFSCKGGMCCTCRCRITDGAAEMAVNYSLEPWEVEAGFTLACQSRPTTEKLTLDFDAV